ncbi:MAG: hypothetical protein SWK76_04360 [Actinomycetota bacterium]|nr:hypothetical protein [Actinomycetota bacterium]
MVRAALGYEGATWTPSIFSVHNRLNGITALNADVAWAAGGDAAYPGPSNSAVLKTADGGASWTTLYSSDSTTFSDITVVDGDNAWMRNGNAVLRTEDGGESWSESSTAGPGNLLGIPG